MMALQFAHTTLLAISGFLFPIAFAISFFTTIIYLYHVHTFFRHLKAYHPSAWAALGEPDLLWNNSLKSNAIFSALLESNVHTEITDAVVSAKLVHIKRLYKVADWGFKVCIGALLLFAVLSNIK